MATLPFLQKFEFPKFRIRFPFGAQSAIGIDVGSQTLKVVQLRKERGRALIETYGELAPPKSGVKEGRVFRGGLLGERDQALVDLMAELLEASAVTSRRVLFAIPATASFLTVVSFPAMGREELKAAIPFEARRYVPIPIPEVSLDWQIIEEDRTSGRMAVLLAAVPHEVIAKFERITKLLGLELAGLEIESFSLVRSLLSQERGVVALIQWGASVVTLSLVDRGLIRLNHNFGRGASEITQALSRSLSISEERAEALKREVGLSQKPEEREISGIIAPYVDSVMIDLERVMVSYNRSSERKVEKIVLSGGGANLKGLVDQVSRHFGLETKIGNPFSRIQAPEVLEPRLKEIGPDFAVAVGLALRAVIPAQHP